MKTGKTRKPVVATKIVKKIIGFFSMASKSKTIDLKFMYSSLKQAIIRENRLSLSNNKSNFVAHFTKSRAMHGKSMDVH
jgi:hypothetical protein